MKMLGRIPLELIFWIVALTVLACAKIHEPAHPDHFTLCPLANVGFDWCPGCGIGRSITHVFHGNFAESFEMHWFGIPALLIIVHRIVVLIKKDIKRIFKLTKEEERYV